MSPILSVQRDSTPAVSGAKSSHLARPVEATSVILADEQLVEHIRLGDESAFEELVRRYYSQLCHLIRADVGVAVASELVQDLFWNIWRMRSDWHVHSNLAGYLVNAAHHLVLSHRRKAEVRDRWERSVAQRGEPTMMGSVGQAADEQIETLELHRVLQQTIDRLPPRCRQVAVLRFMHDYSYGQIAQVLGVTQKAVERQMAKAMTVLRAAVGPMLER